MNIKILPSLLSGTVSAVSSKSDAHRILICAALCDRPTEVRITDLSNDIQTTVDCISAVGASVTITEPSTFLVTPGPPPGKALIHCMESGSTLRFMLPVAAALGLDADFAGAGRLPARPLSPLLEQMQEHGVHFSSASLPLTISGQLQSGLFTLPGNISSQYITGLLMALPLLAGESEIVLTSSLESAGYVDMTLRTLALFGIEIIRNEQGFLIGGSQRYHSPAAVFTEGDWSNAAFWLTAGAIGNPVTVSNLNQDTAQGDSAICGILRHMGAVVEIRADGICASRAKPATTAPENPIDVSGVPDLVPILAIAASSLQGDTTFTNAARLRIKESDRLAAIADTIRRLGGTVTERADSITVHGHGQLLGGKVDSYNDHRIAMAAAIASILCEEPVIIRGADAANKSYPNFWRDFALLGGRTEVFPK